MVWTVKYSVSAKHDLKRLDKKIAQAIENYVSNDLASLNDPKIQGKLLKGNLNNYWSFRFQNIYRIICLFEDENLIITVIRASHRKEVYD